MKRTIAAAVLASSCLLQAVVGQAALDYKIVTASERGTYLQIGRNLAQFIAPAAEFELEALPSAGSAENVRRLRFETGVKFALVQSDVYQAFLDQAAGGNAEAADMIRPLRVILPLFDEEIYFIARADSDLNSIHDIRNAKINVGEIGSGSALTTTTLYRLMFDAPLPQKNASFLPSEDALVKLITDKSVDVVVVIAGQPAKLLADMKPEARDLIKLLRFDPSHPTAEAALKTYAPATVRAASYPNLLNEDVPALAVKAYLVTYDFSVKATEDSLRRFARSLCQNFPVLQEKGHPKWREVELALPELPRGWIYYPASTNELRACIAAKEKAKGPPPKKCSQQEVVLGLCK